jgi:23S rRNA pseudouridine2605 synthase
LVTTLGTTVDPAVDVVVVNGRRLLRRTSLVYVLLHKPRGYVTTCDDEQGRPTVFDLLKRQAVRLFPVGRLDVNSEGLLLLTNDGSLANRMLHPRYRLARTYLVKIQGLITEEEVEQLRRGVGLEDGRTLPAQAQVMRRAEKSCWLRLTLYEGRHRQIHRMLQRCGGYSVKRLQRVAMGPLTLAGLPPGSSRQLESFEVSRLQRACRLQEVAS